VSALDQFHDQPGHTIAFLQAVDDRDVGMIQRGEHFSFALKPRQPLGVCGDGLR
jgi:hypothetical protein